MGLNPYLAQGLVLDSMNLDPQVHNFVHYEDWSISGFRETPGTRIQLIWIQKNQGWKKPGFFIFKKTKPSGFYIYIFAQKREFLGFFQFQEYF
jgi:hypothetical protein